MARQHNGKNKPKHVQHSRAKSGGGVNPKRKPPPTNSATLGTSGPCAQHCGRCVSCLIYQGDEENRQRIRASGRWW